MNQAEEIGSLLASVREHFRIINADRNLTEADKKELKEFYLERMITPKAKAVLQERFPEEFATDGRWQNRGRRIWVNPDGPALAFLRKSKTNAK